MFTEDGIIHMNYANKNIITATLLKINQKGNLGHETQWLNNISIRRMPSMPNQISIIKIGPNMTLKDKKNPEQDLNSSVGIVIKKGKLAKPTTLRNEPTLQISKGECRHSYFFYFHILIEQYFNCELSINCQPKVLQMGPKGCLKHILQGTLQYNILYSQS